VRYSLHGALFSSRLLCPHAYALEREMRAFFERVNAARLSLTACALATALLAACGGGTSDGTTASPAADTSAPADPGTSGAGTATMGALSLSWTAPATNDDGTPISDLAGYRVYYGTASGYYTDNVTISNPSTVTATISNLPADTYYVVVRAFNSVNIESKASNEVSKTIM
jgi:hypothetical protein